MKSFHSFRECVCWTNRAKNLMFFGQAVDDRASFAVQLDGIEALSSPSDFFQSLIDMVRSARREIILSALYLGTGPLERELLQEIDKALSDHQRPQLRVTLLLDHSRSQRKHPVSSLDLLQPLVERHGDRLRVFLYEPPSLRASWARALPAEAREVLGVYHCKFAVGDDAVLLTGANLSAEYFTTRQDRYWLLRPRESESESETETERKSENKSESECYAQREGERRGRARSMAQFLSRFARTVSGDSEELLSNGAVTRRTSSLTTARCETELREMCSSHALSHTLSNEPHNTTHTNTHTQIHTERESSHSSLQCFPVIQLASLRIRDEERLLLSLLDALSVSLKDGESEESARCALRIATPYTNFPVSLLSRIVRVAAVAVVDVLGPHDDSHGFAAGKGVKAMIPSMHREALRRSLIEIDRATHSALSQQPQGDAQSAVSVWRENVNRWAFQRSGWTFHAKGLWWTRGALSPSATESERNTERDRERHTQRERSCGTYIGSSNLGVRSWKRDFELGFVFAGRTRTHEQFLRRDFDTVSAFAVRERSSDVRTVGNKRVLRMMTRLARSLL